MDDDDDDGGDDDRIEKLFKALDGLSEDLAALRDKTAELNSMFPVTRAFLKSKGVENVMELSPEDRHELMAYLQAEHDALLAHAPDGAGPAGKKPPN